MISCITSDNDFLDLARSLKNTGLPVRNACWYMCNYFKLIDQSASRNFRKITISSHLLKLFYCCEYIRLVVSKYELEWFITVYDLILLNINIFANYIKRCVMAKRKFWGQISSIPTVSLWILRVVINIKVFQIFGFFPPSQSVSYYLFVYVFLLSNHFIHIAIRAKCGWIKSYRI